MTNLQDISIQSASLSALIPVWDMVILKNILNINMFKKGMESVNMFCVFFFNEVPVFCSGQLFNTVKRRTEY